MDKNITIDVANEYLIKKEDLDDYCKALALDLSCDLSSTDRGAAHWDFVAKGDTHCMDIVKKYRDQLLNRTIHQCATCNRVFDYKRNLNRHTRNGVCQKVVGRDTGIYCTLCHKSFSTIGMKNRHEKQVHKVLEL